MDIIIKSKALRPQGILTSYFVPTLSLVMKLLSSVTKNSPTSNFAHLRPWIHTLTIHILYQFESIKHACEIKVTQFGGLGRTSLVGKSLSLLGRLEDLEAAHERVINTHHCSRVVEFSAVIGCREERHELPPSEELVAVLDDLVSSADEIKVVLVEELSDDVLAEGEGYSTIVLSPSVNVFVRVRPKKITQQSGVRDVGGSDNALNLIKTCEFGTESAVRAEDLLVDDGRAGKTVETISEGLPKFDTEAALALVIKAVNTVDRRTFVVTAEDEEVFGILDLVS